MQQRPAKTPQLNQKCQQCRNSTIMPTMHNSSEFQMIDSTQQLVIKGNSFYPSDTVEPEVREIHLIFHAEIEVNSPQDTVNSTVKKRISRPNSPKSFTYNMTLFAHRFTYFGSEIHGF
jgi:hypothetical protein